MWVSCSSRGDIGRDHHGVQHDVDRAFEHIILDTAGRFVSDMFV
jgi:hypothetical protein